MLRKQTIVVGGKKMKEKIISVKHMKTIHPVAYKTNLGNVYSYEQTIDAVENGTITNAYIDKDDRGVKHIRYKK